VCGGGGLLGKANSKRHKRQQKRLGFLIIFFSKSLCVKSGWQTSDRGIGKKEHTPDRQFGDLPMLNIQMFLKEKLRLKTDQSLFFKVKVLQ
jgi:hypothetical protein